MNEYNFTHKYLCERAAHWLIHSKNCRVALIERNSGQCGEEPDAIGWTPQGRSYLVEVKVSRSDFKSDKYKPFRQDPKTGMGQSRSILCPKGMILAHECPDGWGLLYATHHQIRLQNPDDLINGKGEHERNYQKEIQMLIHNYRLIKLGVLIVPNEQAE